MSTMPQTEQPQQQQSPLTPIQEFSTGARRGSDLAGCRLSLIPPAALRAWGRAFAEGEQKYGRDNWMRGFPVTAMVDHAWEHMLSFLAGDESEDHLGHMLWNIGAIIHFMENNPELDDRPKYWEHSAEGLQKLQAEHGGMIDHRGGEWHSETEVELPPSPPQPVTPTTVEELVKNVYPHAWVHCGHDRKYRIDKSCLTGTYIHISDACGTHEAAWQSALDRIQQSQSGLGQPRTTINEHAIAP